MRVDWLIVSAGFAGCTLAERLAERLVDDPQDRSAGHEPYCPIPREDNRTQYERYLNEAAKLDGTVMLAGRLAEYRYSHMDPAVARALKIFEEIV